MPRTTDGPITASWIVRGKLYAATATTTYRVRLRKRWRDKNKPMQPAQLRRQVLGSAMGCLPPGSVIQ